MATRDVPGINDRIHLRRGLREQRRALVGAARRAAQHRLTRELVRLPVYRRARSIAVYFDTDGEVELEAVIADARKRRKTVYAPVLADSGLRFVDLSESGGLRRNRYGILEPSHGHERDPRRLDLVLTPLVAFDRRGTRLGMGKGYYDRTFAFLKLRAHWLRPKLVGVAFAFQQRERIDEQPWDVKLWAAVTERGVHRFDAGATS